MIDYNKTLKQLDNAENVYGREIGILNRTIDNNKIKENKLKNNIQNLEDTIQEKLNEIYILIVNIEKIKNISENNKKILQKKLMSLLIIMIN